MSFSGIKTGPCKFQYLNTGLKENLFWLHHLFEISEAKTHSTYNIVLHVLHVNPSFVTCFNISLA